MELGDELRGVVSEGDERRCCFAMARLEDNLGETLRGRSRSACHRDAAEVHP